VFQFTQTGALTTLYGFDDASDGGYPAAPLVQASNGNLYGTTIASNFSNGGTAFEVNLAGHLTTIYNFCSQPDCSDGWFPYGLIQATNGDLYGTTQAGGTGGYGTAFKLTPDGKVTTLHAFDHFALPYAGLVQATDGNFYGTTSGSGFGDGGTIFQLTPEGKISIVHSFCSPPGCKGRTPLNPSAPLMQATNGTLYGTTVYGDRGTIFSLSMGLAPFVQTVPVAGKVGSKVTILGNNLTGTTGVTFNGTPATFEVVSATGITATVPTGATTGIVEVVTPDGPRDSNVQFRVLQ
jgi:uncharacterized repeat protein (TIGR03803 family)